jgi:aminoglycoside 6-adenylyltransferase
VRNQEQVLTEIKAWVFENQHVRGAILTSSRANPNATTDLFSDYDVELVVTERKEFLIHEQWLSSFGEILISYGEDNEEFSMRLVLYKDYARIDFKVYEPVYLERYTQESRLPEHWDLGYRILSDKDGTLAAFAAPSYAAFVISKPTENEFIATINDFWWDTIYVAKSLWRNEIYFAKYMLDGVIRFTYLQKMIEWHIGLAYHWRVSTNKHGKYFNKYLDAENWKKLQSTFAGDGIEQNWDALVATTKLFGQLSKAIARELNYFYPQKTEDGLRAYLEKIRDLESDAHDII